MISFKYKYKPEVFKKDPKEFNFAEAKLTDFDLDKREYEKWRNSKVVIEFLDEPFKSGTGQHYPSKMNPSAIWVKGKSVDIPENNLDIDVNEYLMLLMKLTDVDSPKDIWIVQDKNDSNDNKNFYCDIDKGDRFYAIEFLTDQSKKMVGTMMRDPDNPENLNGNIGRAHV